MKPPLHRPQIVRSCLRYFVSLLIESTTLRAVLTVIPIDNIQALLLALHKLKVSEEQRKFAVDVPEPLVAFALSCGMYSSPAVRSQILPWVMFDFKEKISRHT